MKIVVLGGAGAMGQVIARDLAETAADLEIVIADFNQVKAKELAASLGGGRVVGVFADITKQSQLVEVLTGAKVVINSTPYIFNVNVMEAALQANCHYLDLGGLFHTTVKQLELHKRFQDKALLAVLGIGAAPGMTNIMAASAAADLDSIDSIDIAVGCVDFVKQDHPLAPPYALDTILDEYTKEPMVFENGKLAAKPAMSGEITIDFPKPVGQSNAILTLHSEVLTLPDSYKAKGVRNVTFRLGLPPEFHEKLKLLVDLGFGGVRPVQIAEGTFTPRKVLAKLIEQFPAKQVNPDDCEVVRVDVAGVKSGSKKLVRMEATVFSDNKRHISCGALDTGVPPSIVAQMIARGEIRATGALAPELCVPTEAFFTELRKREIDVKKIADAVCV